MNPAPIITTDRIHLLSPNELTIEKITVLDSNPEVMKYIGHGVVRSREESELWLKNKKNDFNRNGFGLMPAHLRSDDTFIGWAGLIYLDDTDKIEIGYRFARPFWNSGYATEITRALIQYAHSSLGFTDLVAITNPENIASKRVLEKCGFTYRNEAFHYGFDVSYFELRH